MMDDINLPCMVSASPWWGALEFAWSDCLVRLPFPPRAEWAHPQGGSRSLKSAHCVPAPQNTCTLFCRPWALDTYLDMCVLLPFSQRGPVCLSGTPGYVVHVAGIGAAF